MADSPETQNDQQAPESQNPEVLKPREDDAQQQAEDQESKKDDKKKKKGLRRGHYRLGHRGTFIGAAVVVLILAINAGVLFFVLRGQQDSETNQLDGQVAISSEVLEGLGINRSSVIDEGVELVVGPNATFNKRLKVGGDVSIGGALTLNDEFSAPAADFTQLQAGDAAVEQLNINGDATVTNLIARSDFTVAGRSRLQGPVTVGELFTAEGNVVITGDLTVGGDLGFSGLSVARLTVGNSLTVGGHIHTVGSAPSVSPGPAAGNNGTVSISGNDIAGTVAVNTGTGAGGGIVANVTFNNAYNEIPRVVVTPIGNVGVFYIFRNAQGFSIGVDGSLSPGGYAFDYIVAQ